MKTGRRTRGTVATWNSNVKPLAVLRAYEDWPDTPKHWGDNRARELAVAVRWALRKIPAAAIKSQEEVEDDGATPGQEKGISRHGCGG